MNLPKELKYARTHEWIKVKGESVCVGITDYAQEQLTDVIFVELPRIGRMVSQGEPVAVLESVKSVSDIYAPVSGEIVEGNKELENKPELINQEPYERGWLFKLKMKDPKELDSLLGATEYEESTKEEKI
jgi:glycine cleavage system H protein